MEAIHRNCHFFPGGIFLWQFDDKKEISFRDYLQNLADVLFPEESQKNAPEPGFRQKFLKFWKDTSGGDTEDIFKEFSASTLLILDHADTLVRAAAESKKDAQNLVYWLQN